MSPAVIESSPHSKSASDVSANATREADQALHVHVIGCRIIGITEQCVRDTEALVALTQYTDMIRALGEGSNTNTILLPHSPSAVGDLMAQIRDGILVADVASGTVTGAGRAEPNGGPTSGSPRGHR